MATFERQHSNVSDFEDFEDDEELLGSNKLYELEYADEELREMEAQRAERERASVDTAPTGAAVENRDRTSGDWWCQCRECIQRSGT